MTTSTLTTEDLQLRDAVIQALDWDPRVDAGTIGVSVAQHGAITLTGFIDSYAAKLAAERVAKRVKGVRAVANDIEVRLRMERTDSDIADDAARALTFTSGLPDTVQVAAHFGHVTLTGMVAWLFQKYDAEAVLRHIRGVRTVTNLIQVAVRPAHADAKRSIMLAMRREADLDSRGVHVAVSGHTVALTGTVATWQQRELAERAAANAPGIRRIDNRLVVEPVEPEQVQQDIC